VSDWIDPVRAGDAMRGGDGRGVRIAVLDSGIEIAHPAFAGRVLSDDLAFDPAREAVEQRGDGLDQYGHGTALAGIIWEVAPAAEIGSFRVLGPDLNARTAAVAAAARAALERGYHVINCSFACVIPGHMPIYKNWLDRAAVEGVHVVAAGSSAVSARPEWPAHFTSVLSVDCLTGGDHGHIERVPGSLVEFRARGEGVRVPWLGGTHRMMTGSSFAAAHLTGLLARLLSTHPLRDAHQVKALLQHLAAHPAAS